MSIEKLDTAGPVPATADQRGADAVDVDGMVIQLFALVEEGIAGATEAFLDGDRETARRVVADDQRIDSLQVAIEHIVESRLEQDLASPAPLDRSQIRRLIAALRIVPELERSGDLVEHIAMRTSYGLARDITPEARALIAEMGALAAEMWRTAADAYADRDPGAAQRLRLRDDLLDDLHVRLSTELSETGTSVPVAMQMSLIARFYERLGDHAVNVVRRVCGSLG